MKKTASIAFFFSWAPFLFATQPKEKPLPMVFQRVLEISEKKTFLSKRQKQSFTSHTYRQLLQRAKQAKSIAQMSLLINRFFQQSQIPARFLTPNEQDYYLFDDFETKDAQRYRRWHIGLQTKWIAGKHIVQAVFEGYPAFYSGIRRADILVSANQKPFHPVRSFSSGGAVRLSFLRNQRKLVKTLVPVYESGSFSMLQATRASIQILQIGHLKVGYIHVWHLPISRVAFRMLSFMLDSLISKVEGLVLDLRDGGGGDIEAGLSLFVYNSPLKMTWISSDGSQKNFIYGRPQRPFYLLQLPTKKFQELLNKTLPMKELEAQAESIVRSQGPPIHSQKQFHIPLVVLINQGTHTAKEILAFHLKHSKRAILVGTNTAGRPPMRIASRSRKDRYILLTAKQKLKINDRSLEGGVAPHIWVKNAACSSVPQDLQRQMAQQILLQQIRATWRE